MRDLVFGDFIRKAIIFIIVLFMASTACAMESFDDMKIEVCKVVREIVSTDVVIQDDELFSGIICAFINELTQSSDAKLFLAKFSSFKNDSHWKVKSFQNFLASLIGSRVKPVFQCLCDLIKLLPEDYVQRYIFDWLEWSLRSGKQLYFKFFLDEYGQYCEIKRLQALSGKPPYSALPPESQNRYEVCKELLSDYLNKQLSQEVLLSPDFGIDCDSDSESDISDVDDEKAAQILVRLSNGLVLICSSP